MAKRPGKAVAPAAAPQTDIVVSGRRIEAAYRVPDLQPSAKGEWRREPDKLAWTDPATGYPCIIRRNEDGHLSGFVGIPATHPLFLFSADAIPGGLIDAHDGIDYAEPCDETGPEERSVCHVPDRARSHDDRHWIGFSCNRVDDLVPDDASHAREAQRLGIDQIYRTAEYVLAECTSLATQLKALETEGDR